MIGNRQAHALSRAEFFMPPLLKQKVAIKPAETVVILNIPVYLLGFPLQSASGSLTAKTSVSARIPYSFSNFNIGD